MYPPPPLERACTCPQHYPFWCLISFFIDQNFNTTSVGSFFLRKLNKQAKSSYMVNLHVDYTLVSRLGRRSQDDLSDLNYSIISLYEKEQQLFETLGLHN